jgi:acyl carrier protein
LPTGQALALFDAALAGGRSTVVPAALDTAALRAHADGGTLPPVLRGLVRAPLRRVAVGGQAGGPSGLEQRLAGLAPDEQHGLLLELTAAHVAAVLGYAVPGAVAPDTTFQELGLDSLGAVELRNRLGAATGLRLPATTVFDYPTANLLAGHLKDRVAPEEEASPRPVLAELDRLDARIVDLRPEARTKLALRMQDFLLKLNGSHDGQGDPGATIGADVQAASDDEIFNLIDNELGLS